MSLGDGSCALPGTGSQSQLDFVLEPAVIRAKRWVGTAGLSVAGAAAEAGPAGIEVLGLTVDLGAAGAVLVVGASVEIN
jgi:hypothetical protein